MIRVMIERRVIPELDDLYRQLSKDTLVEAGNVEGFMSGEALQDRYKPTHYYVMATWRSEVFWERWLQSETRKHLSSQMRHVLEEDERYTVLQSVV